MQERAATMSYDQLCSVVVVVVVDVISEFRELQPLLVVAVAGGGRRAVAGDGEEVARQEHVGLVGRGDERDGGERGQPEQVPDEDGEPEAGEVGPGHPERAQHGGAAGLGRQHAGAVDAHEQRGAYRVCFVHTARASESHSRRSDLAGDAVAATPPPCGRVGSGGCRDGRDGRRRGAAGVSLPSDCCPPSSYAPPPAHSPREDDALPSLRRFPEDRSTPGTSHAIFRRE